MKRQRGTIKSMLTVYCDSGHEPTVMLSVLSNMRLTEQNVNLWCPTCNKTGILEINSARIITNYDENLVSL